MTRFFTSLLLLVGIAILGADQPDNGIYLRIREETAQSAMSQDGQKIYLGKKQELKILKSELSSENNANDRFLLELTLPYNENLKPASYILIVTGVAYAQSESAELYNKEMSLIRFRFSGNENAKQVSEYLKTPVVYRMHPQYNLRVLFIPSKQEFSVREEVTATLQIANVGTNSIAFMKGGRNRAARDNQYIFSAHLNFRQVNDIGSSFDFGGACVSLVLKPGGVFEDKISLSKWFAFDKAGIYEIHGSYYLAFTDPGSKSCKTIWEDYVSSDFTVHIIE